MAAGKIKTIVLFGAGNLASGLAPVLIRKGYRILQVCNRSEAKGRALARKVKAEYLSDPRKVTGEADLYLLAVSDDAIPGLAAKIGKKQGIAVHFSGTRKGDVLGRISASWGVVYPVQTFPAGRPAGFRGVPFCLEAKEAGTAKLLAEFAGKISGNVIPVTYVQRKTIHLAAVFANNFPNFMAAIARELLLEKGLPAEILHPLIKKTLAGLREEDPFRNQTGPAMRGDRAVLEEHLAMLKRHPSFEKIYRVLTENIIQFKKRDGKLQGTA
ncbi:MAG TPA: DUF2520 domain-containing protein [Bacteroidales bacterium]|nr:DUF2520 domain-containing protein [Bacteroidales bacterium]